MHLLIVPMLVAALPMGAEETRPRMAVLGFGSCDSALLQTATRELRAAIDASAPGSVLDEEKTAAPGGKLVRASLDEVRRQVEAAKREFLNLDVPRSEKLFATALDAIERLPLGPQRWELWVTAKVNFARMLQYAGRDEDAIKQLLEILWLKEDFELNRTEFPPSTRELLDRTRVLLKAQPRHELTVRSRPEGATVYISGYAMGKTPFRREMPLGVYEVVARDGDRFSFRRTVSLTAPRTVEIDIEAEGGFRPQHGPCMELHAADGGDAERNLRLSMASLVAGALDVDQVVAVRLSREGGSDGEQYVAAALVDRSGREIREGREEARGVRLASTKKLAEFVLTGERHDVVAEVLAPPAPAPEIDPRATGPTTATIDGGMKWTQITSIALGGAAVLLAGGALVSHIQAVSYRSDLQALSTGTDGTIAESSLEHAKRLRKEIPAAEDRRLYFAIGAGALAVGSGVFLGVSYIDFARDGGGGAGLSVSGTF